MRLRSGALRKETVAIGGVLLMLFSWSFLFDAVVLTKFQKLYHSRHEPAVEYVKRTRRKFNPPYSNETSKTTDDADRPNILFIVCDQLRYDALRFVQDTMPHYDDKVKIRTPNLDMLAARGTVFNTTYCGSPICGPSRTIIKTGATLQRTGTLHNRLTSAEAYEKMDIFKDRVADMASFEQILAERLDYTVEYYGKWHAPFTLFYGIENRTRRAIDNTFFDYVNETFGFNETVDFTSTYTHALQDIQARDHYNTSSRTFVPLQIHPSYGRPANFNETTDLEHWRLGQDFQAGWSGLPPKYSATAVLGDMAINALDRLISDERKNPFLLSVHFDAPHPAFVVAKEYLDYYYENRDKLFLPPSIYDDMENSAFQKSTFRQHINTAEYVHNKPEVMAEVTAAYYGMIEHVDEWVGKLLGKLSDNAQRDTMVVFTSDHGEMLGAHGTGGKVVLLEEAVRVPLILSYPDRIPAGIWQSEPVAQMDLHATFLDYAGGSQFDQSDGKSLRRLIEKTSFNEHFDETAVVSELDLRTPKSETELRPRPGRTVNYMIRKGNWKLMLPQIRSSPVLDMLYNVESDPYELHNYIGDIGESASDVIIGKAEHLKVLLLEWMRRHDSSKRYYSDSKYSLGDGEGDIAEVGARRKWRQVDWWQSDQVLEFGEPALVGGRYRRNEYLYVGRTSPGLLNVSSITVAGPDAGLFTLDQTEALLPSRQHVRIQVAFHSEQLPKNASIDARIEFRSNVKEMQVVRIGLDGWDD